MPATLAQGGAISRRKGFEQPGRWMRKRCELGTRSASPISTEYFESTKGSLSIRCATRDCSAMRFTGSEAGLWPHKEASPMELEIPSKTATMIEALMLHPRRHLHI